MKRVFVALLLAVTAISTSAQFVSDRSVWREERPDNDFTHSGVFLNPNVGVSLGDGCGFGFGLDLGYRLRLSNCFALDLLTAGVDFSTNTGESGLLQFYETATLRLLTGIRYNSPAIIGDKYGLYANLGVGAAVLFFGVYYNEGYQDSIDSGSVEAECGFALDLGFGVNLSRNISLGLFYQGNYMKTHWERYLWHHDDDSYTGASTTANIIGVRLGINF